LLFIVSIKPLFDAVEVGALQVFEAIICASA